MSVSVNSTEAFTGAAGLNYKDRPAYKNTVCTPHTYTNFIGTAKAP